MYESFYGLKGKPFQLNPDPAFWFGSSQHKRAMAFVEYGLHQSEGFIVVTGEVGAGKTTLVRNLLGNLDRNEVAAAHLVSTQLEAEDMLRMVAAAFGIRTRDLDKAQLLLTLEAFLADCAQKGKRCLLVVDEAQNLSPRAVEELRMLSNFQLGTHALLQSFLVGQPEFRHLLASPEFNQLRQRVIAACHIGPMSAAETRHYVEHRLRHVGWEGRPMICDDAFAVLHEASGGVPRRINLLADRMLMSGFLADRRVFHAEHVREVADEMAAETRPPADAAAPVAAPVDRLRPANEEPARTPLAVVANGEAPYGVIDRLHAEAVSGRLDNMRQDLQQVHATALRIEQSQHSTLTLFRRFLDWMRTHEDTPR